MIILSLDNLKAIAKNRGIKDYENKSEDGLIKIHDETTKTRLSKKRIKDIRKDVNKSRHMFSKSKIKQIRKSLHDKKTQKIFLNQK